MNRLFDQVSGLKKGATDVPALSKFCVVVWVPARSRSYPIELGRIG
ncbi:hypothetical protein [Hymenobacter nivis]|nr:hypothetical protein [Hymenobacter nivis]